MDPVYLLLSCHESYFPKLHRPEHSCHILQLLVRQHVRVVDDGGGHLDGGGVLLLQQPQRLKLLLAIGGHDPLCPIEPNRLTD